MFWQVHYWAHVRRRVGVRTLISLDIRAVRPAAGSGDQRSLQAPAPLIPHAWMTTDPGACLCRKGRLRGQRESVPFRGGRHD